METFYIQRAQKQFLKGQGDLKLRNEHNSQRVPDGI